MCDCHNCRTGQCSCPECVPGKGIDFQAIHRLESEIRRAVAIQQVRITDMRSPDVPRVRRWGDIERPAIAGPDKETGEKDHE